MKRNFNIVHIAGLALVLIFCFSTTAVLADSYARLSGSGSEECAGASTKSFEIDVKGETVTDGIPDNPNLTGFIHVSIVAKCSNCGAYLKITDPNGRVVLDRSTAETGFVTNSFRGQNYTFTNPVPGKYTVWFKPSDVNEDVKLECSISGLSKQ